MSVAASGETWRYPRRFGRRHLLLFSLALAVLGVMGARLGIEGMVARTAGGIAALVGLGERSPDGAGATRIVGQMARIRLSEVRDTATIPGFDSEKLPPFARIETRSRSVVELDPETGRQVRRIETVQVLVEPIAYAVHVSAKLIETLEIALWGTLVAVLIGTPLALLGAANVMPSRTARAAARGVVGLLRAIPELIIALLLVIAYGFGPIAGVLAIGIHGAGFLGKFYADEMEAVARAPQHLLTGMGLGPMLVMRHAVLPQALPQFVAQTLYVLDRNVRMATVVGLVGAGGIGQELKGRFDLYEYDRVGTILLGMLIIVLLLEALSTRFRKRWLT